MSNPNFTDAIILFGDSITESNAPGSLEQRMSEWYTRRLDVINRGFGGYNTTCVFASKEQQESGKAQKVKLMTIWFGANDAVKEGELQYVSIEKYKSNLSHMVNLIKSPDSEYYSPDTRLLLITPGPIIQAAENPTREFKRTEQYAEACVQVAKEEKVPVLDLFKGMVEVAGGSSPSQLAPFFTDGLHMTAEGYRVVFELLQKEILRSYPEMDPARLKNVVTEWKEMGQ